MEEKENFDDLEDVIKETFKEELNILILQHKLNEIYSFLSILSCLDKNADVRDIKPLAINYRDNLEELIVYISSFEDK